MSATRRGLFGAAALFTVVPLTAQATPNHPDAELIAACNGWLSASRKFDRYYATLSDDIEHDDPGWRMLDECPAFEEKIVALRATTPEAFLAKAQCMAFISLPHNQACVATRTRPRWSGSRPRCFGT